MHRKNTAMTGHIVLVGYGRMGRAMLEGWLASGHIMLRQLLVIEPDESLRVRTRALGVQVASDARDIDDTIAPQLIIFAIKPDAIPDVVPSYAHFKGCATYLSVAAGTSIATLEKMLGHDAAIIRCMPNTPAAVGKGAMAIVANSHVKGDVTALVYNLLSANGEVVEIADEAFMHAVTAVSGSGPAYIFYFIECLIDAGKAAGLPTAVARQLATQTVYGAAALALHDGKDAGELRSQVTSPNGTTAAALSILMKEERFKTLIEEAVEAARSRSVELSR